MKTEEPLNQIVDSARINDQVVAVDALNVGPLPGTQKITSFDKKVIEELLGASETGEVLIIDNQAHFITH